VVAVPLEKKPVEPALARTISPRGRMFFDTKNLL